MNYTYQAEKINNYIWCLDTAFIKPKSGASYLLISNNQVALFDCGVLSSTKFLLQQIDEIRVQNEQITALFLTHAHLDHAGGTGLLIDSLPNATIYGHKDTIRHLVAPEKLEQGVRSVYGDENFEKNYQKILPLEKSRCQTLDDQESVFIGNTEIISLYTPGHAWHHLSYYCPEHSYVFSGDAFGMSFRQLNTTTSQFCYPATPPSHFAPKEMIESFQKITDTKADKILVTHYGIINNPKKTQNQLTDLVNSCSELVIDHYNDNNYLRENWIKLHLSSFQKNGDYNQLTKFMTFIESEVKLHTDGLKYWAKKHK